LQVKKRFSLLNHAALDRLSLRLYTPAI